MSQGAEFAGGIIVFFLIGLGLDVWLDTTPIFMVALTVFSMVGQFVKMYYAYSSAMDQEQKKRADSARGDQ